MTNCQQVKHARPSSPESREAKHLFRGLGGRVVTISVVFLAFGAGLLVPTERVLTGAAVASLAFELVQALWDRSSEAPRETDAAPSSGAAGPE
jgi:hypothetical protein